MAIKAYVLVDGAVVELTTAGGGSSDGGIGDAIVEAFQYLKENISESKLNTSDFNAFKDNAVTKGDLLDAVYPVGAIYLSANDTSPAVLFGGTWRRIEGSFLLASGNGRATGSTGGSETHTLTVSELPSHTHEYVLNSPTDHKGWPNGSADEGDSVTVSQSYWRGFNSNKQNSSSVGGATPFSIIPPFIAVSVWVREA